MVRRFSYNDALEHAAQGQMPNADMCYAMWRYATGTWPVQDANQPLDFDRLSNEALQGLAELGLVDRPPPAPSPSRQPSTRTADGPPAPYREAPGPSTHRDRGSASLGHSSARAASASSTLIPQPGGVAKSIEESRGSYRLASAQASRSSSYHHGIQHRTPRKQQAAGNYQHRQPQMDDATATLGPSPHAHNNDVMLRRQAHARQASNQSDQHIKEESMSRETQQRSINHRSSLPGFMQPTPSVSNMPHQRQRTMPASRSSQERFSGASNQLHSQNRRHPTSALVNEHSSLGAAGSSRHVAIQSRGDTQTRSSDTNAVNSTARASFEQILQPGASLEASITPRASHRSDLRAGSVRRDSSAVSSATKLGHQRKKGRLEDMPQPMDMMVSQAAERSHASDTRPVPRRSSPLTDAAGFASEATGPKAAQPDAETSRMGSASPMQISQQVDITVSHVAESSSAPDSRPAVGHSSHLADGADSLSEAAGSRTAQQNTETSRMRSASPTRIWPDGLRKPAGHGSRTAALASSKQGEKVNIPSTPKVPPRKANQPRRNERSEQDRNIADLLQLGYRREQDKTREVTTENTALDVQPLIVNQTVIENMWFSRAFDDIVRKLVGYLRNHRNDPPGSLGEQAFTLDDISAVLNQVTELPNPLSGRSFKEQKRLLKQYQGAQEHREINKRWVESFYHDLIEGAISAERQDKVGRTPSNIDKKRVALELGILSTTDRNVNETLRFWRRLSSFRMNGWIMILLFRSEATNSILHKANEEQIESIAGFNALAQEIYHRTRKHLDEMIQGDYRGHAQIPAEIAGDALHRIWYTDSGRWKSIEDACKFQRQYGLPELRNNLLTTEVCYEYGFMGYQQKQGMPFVTLLQVGSDPSTSPWRCVCIAECDPGTVFGFAPHVLTYATSANAATDHIYARNPDIDYDPLVIAGTLSFIERVDSEAKANVKLASDYHCDLAIPDLYSIRVAVVAVKPVRPMEPLRMFGGTTHQAEEMNRKVQELILGRPEDESMAQIPLEDAFAVTLQDLAQYAIHLRVTGQHDPACVLDEQYYKPNIASAPAELVPVSAEHMPLITHCRVVDLEQEDEIQAYAESYKQYQHLMRDTDIDLKKMGLYGFALSAIRATEAPPRKKATIRDNPKVNEVLKQGQSHLETRLPSWQPAKGLDVVYGHGAFAVAMQMVYSIEPLRRLFDKTTNLWKNHYLAHQDAQQLTGHGDQIASLRRRSLREMCALFSKLTNKDRSTTLDASVVNKTWDAFEKCFSDQLRPHGDALEIFTMIHGLLLETLFMPSDDGVHDIESQSLSTKGTRSADKSAVVKQAKVQLRNFYMKDNRVPFLADITLGAQLTEYWCKSTTCGLLRYTSMQLVSELMIPVPARSGPTRLVDEIRKWYGTVMTDVEHGEFCGRCGKEKWLRVSTQLAILPEYLVVHLARSTAQKTERPAKVDLPDSLAIDLGYLSVAKDACTYQIVATTELRWVHCGQRPTFVCCALRDGKWFLLDKSTVMPLVAGDVRVSRSILSCISLPLTQV